MGNHLIIKNIYVVEIFFPLLYNRQNCLCHINNLYRQVDKNVDSVNTLSTVIKLQ